MGAEPDWRALLTDCEAALEQFEVVSKALTAALLQPRGPNGETGALSRPRRELESGSFSLECGW
jgi:hypothetical protein